MKNYKSLFYLLVLSFTTLFLSCEEEERGPLVTDKTIPGVVSEVTVENMPGGAKIQYKVPATEDILLVEAAYERNGELITARSSVYKNFVNIEGLNKTTPQEVSLSVVDRSDNRSQAVTVTINPQTPPIDTLFESISMTADFGGVRVYYDNKDNIKAEILFYTINANGTPTYNQSAFIDNNVSNYTTFRTFGPVPQKFGVALIDRWNNITTITEATITPFEEVNLAKEDYDTVFLPTDEPTRFGWTLDRLFDNNLGTGFHTDQTRPGALIPPYTEPYHMFTLDLGAVAKISRLRLWQRGGTWAYTHGNPRYFEIWGIDEIPADDGASFDGWTLLIANGEVIKPSGAAIGVRSAEDDAAAAAGHEFDAPIDAPPIRYIRFVQIENWTEGKFLHVMEFEFWGQLQ
ncbi:DUF4959 domain-containing protein [Cellulophaga sp. F20128]|uniref:DUF5000 domain-containing lipoprotein n=1 Tax=Cellulophaga sp. F20128 TaxID=2926413 RepID=UPI001FF33017|nr:DUF5000 domain-containing lipoprotein [Cellulophaga sp. F20128]MCK0155714.1 DUF4959 domain-containing protein [Cellulophaga sp. F20128]